MTEKTELVVLKLEVTVRTLRAVPSAEFRTHVYNKLSNAGNRALRPLTKAGYLSGASWTTIYPSSPGSFADLHPGDVKTGNPLEKVELSDAVLQIVAIEVCNSNHGDFLKHVARAWLGTDRENRSIMRAAWKALVDKNKLEKEYANAIAEHIDEYPAEYLGG